jgi:hypothetical protein
MKKVNKKPIDTIFSISYISVKTEITDKSDKSDRNVTRDGRKPELAKTGAVKIYRESGERLKKR